MTICKAMLKTTDMTNGNAIYNTHTSSKVSTNTETEASYENKDNANRTDANMRMSRDKTNTHTIYGRYT